jgi:hypothetical protein
VRENHPDENPAPNEVEPNNSTLKTQNPKFQNPHLSDYEKARLEGKSHLEALYAQFTPTPEEFARRKRENEELRRASEPPDYQQSTHPTMNPQQYYGPCPPPYSWQGHRPLDPWKVHTS